MELHSIPEPGQHRGGSPKIQRTLSHGCQRQSQNSFRPIKKCIHQGPRPSLQRHSTIRTKLPSDAILQHHRSRRSKAPPKHQPQQGWRAERSSLPYAEGAGGRDRACVDLHIHTEPYDQPGPIWVEETMDYLDLQPIYKKGPKCEASNYRPVSLTNVMSKLLEHIICSQVRGHLDTHGILTWFQHGFQAGRSSETQLAVTMHDLHKLADLGTQVDIGILEFSKAFDIVPHTWLLNKLQFYGINDEVCCWIRNFLEGRTQRVMVDGVFSLEENVDSGVPQGTVLGPLLFLLFINDITTNLNTGTRIRLFADDCLIYRAIHSIQDQILLQQDLDTLQSWSMTWGMKFNPSKCNILWTRQGPKGTLNRFYQLHGEILAEVPTAKYLGVNISNNLSWTPHVDYVVKKANQKLGFLRRNLRGSPVSSKCLAYTSLVRSGLEYATPIWDPITDKDSWKIESIQRRAARWAKSPYSPSASITELLQELGWDDLSNRRKNLRLTLLYKIYYHQVAVDYAELDITRNPRPSRQHEHQIRQLPARKNTFLFSFVTRTIQEWNSLPANTISADSATTFKSQLPAATPWAAPPLSRVGHLWHLGTIVQIQIQMYHPQWWWLLGSHSISKTHTYRPIFELWL